MRRRNRPGVATVVLVHTAREPVPPAALAALDAVEWPAGRRDVVVVDCEGSGGAARPWAERAVTVVAAGGDPGLAAARNQGAEWAEGEYVAFLDGAARPRPDWLLAALEVFAADGSVACVAPAVGALGPPAVSFAGQSLPGAAAATAADVLHPRADALVVRAETFRRVGGFDGRYERFGEDVDLGWRLWLLGHRVRACPASVVSTSGSPGATVAPARHRFLRERNALATIFKHYDDHRLARALPAAVALALYRSSLEGEDEGRAARQAVEAFVAALPDLARTRRHLQQARRRTDAELLPLLGRPLEPPAGDGPIVAAHHAVLDAFGVPAAFGPRRRVLVVTGDALTAKMAGPAIRAWQIAAALAADHDVCLATTSGRGEVTSPTFAVQAAGAEDLRRLHAWCDVVVLQGAVLESHPFLGAPAKVVVVDVYDPLHLEQLEARDQGDAVRRASVANATAVLNDQLARGDLFLCATPKQRDFWLGQLSALGRVNPRTYDEDGRLGSLLTVVPFGLPAEPPVHTKPALKGVVPGIGADDEVVLWGGGVYDWFDPLTLVRAVDGLRHRRPRVRLVFMGLRHPNPQEPGTRMARATRELADGLGLTGTHVFFNEGWIDYHERQNHLLEADVGVSTHLDHLETEFSFRTRILDYIWAGLPIVATAGDAFAELIERERLGLTVPAGDVGALEEALFRVLDDAELAESCGKNLAAVRPQFTWSEALRPLVAFCRAPRRAPDLVDPGLAAEVGRVALPVRGGWRRDVAIAVAHLRDGGPPLLAEKALSRLRHRLS